MNTYEIKRALRQFTGTECYWKHLYPAKSPLLLFDSILIFQTDKRLKGANFQIWTLQQSKKDLSWLLICREDSNLKPLISQVIEFSDFPLDYIKLYVIQGIALLPSEN
jgi:hypothetical protein